MPEHLVAIIVVDFFTSISYKSRLEPMFLNETENTFIYRKQNNTKTYLMRKQTQTQDKSRTRREQFFSDQALIWGNKTQRWVSQSRVLSRCEIWVWLSRETVWKLPYEPSTGTGHEQILEYSFHNG